MNIQNRKHMLKWHSWNTNRKLRVLVSMIMIFHETQCLSNWGTFPTILKIFSITHIVVPHVALFEARSYTIRLFINDDCNYSLFGEKFISFYNVYISISKASTSEIQRVYATLKTRTSPTMFSYRRFDAVYQGLVITNIFTRFKFATVSQNVKIVKIVWFGKGHLLNFK